MPVRERAGEHVRSRRERHEERDVMPRHLETHVHEQIRERIGEPNDGGERNQARIAAVRARQRGQQRERHDDYDRLIDV